MKLKNQEKINIIESKNYGRHNTKCNESITF